MINNWFDNITDFRRKFDWVAMLIVFIISWGVLDGVKDLWQTHWHAAADQLTFAWVLYVLYRQGSFRDRG